MKIIFTILLLLFSFSRMSMASDEDICPKEIEFNPNKINLDTKAGINMLSKKLSEGDAAFNYQRERTSILTSIPNADQVIIVNMFFRVQCLLIMRNDSWTIEKKLEEIKKAQAESYRKVSIGNPIASTKDNGSMFYMPDIKIMLVNYHSVMNRHSLLVSWRNVQSNNLTCDDCLAKNDRLDFLKNPPFVVTKANKYFVIVSSAPSQDSAIKEMYRLKRKTPQYDFVVYAPYGDNPNYGVMMATWVSYEVAKQALELARRDVKSDSFIWSCRQEGNAC